MPVRFEFIKKINVFCNLNPIFVLILYKSTKIMKPEKKQRILAAADKLFSRFGINKTGMDEIARLSRVARGTLYNYFGSKDGILEALIKEKLHDFDSLIGRKLSGILDPVDRLKSTIRERINISLSTPFLMMHPASPEDETVAASFYRELDSKSGTVLAPIIDSLYGSTISSADRESLLHTLLCTLRGLEASLREKSAPPPQERLEGYIDNMVGMILCKKSRESR